MIKPLEAKDLEIYEVLNRQYGTIFTSLEWLKLFTPRIKLYGLYNKNRELIGGIAIYLEKKYGLKIVKNPPVTPCSLWITPSSSSKIFSIQSYYKSTLKELAYFLKEKFSQKILYLSFPYSITDFQPFIWEGFKVSPRYTYLLNLNVCIDDIKEQMSPARRNDIRKALRDGLEIREIKTIEDKKTALDLVAHTFKRQNKQIDLDIIKKILFKFLKPQNGFGYITYREEIPLATSICIYDKRTAYYILGGYNSKEKHHGAGALSLWNCILKAKEKNLRTFDFEGSMIPNIERYFRGFGGKITPYFAIARAPFVIECFFKIFKRSIF